MWSYVPIEKTGEILALGEAEGGQLFWQFYDGSENLRGSVEKTEDPNLYLLLDSSKTIFGLVHVAWSEGAEKGFVYLRIGEGGFRRMNKIAPVPVYRPLE